MRINRVSNLVEGVLTNMGYTCIPNDTNPARNVIDIQDSNGNNINSIYYKLRDDKAGFWGLSSEVLKDLDKLNCNYMILLISDMGVSILPRSKVEFIKGACSMNEKGNYLVFDKEVDELSLKHYKF